MCKDNQYSFSHMNDDNAPIPLEPPTKRTVTPIPSKENSDKTKAVFFDFDGTITVCPEKHSSWEKMWLKAGYNVTDCEKLHKAYSNGEFDHPEWCLRTEKCFKQKRLSMQGIKEVADEVKVLNNTHETLKHLSNHGIQIFIISGALDFYIRRILSNAKSKRIFDCNPLEHISRIHSNKITFESTGQIEKIISQKCDFKHKAQCIKTRCEELNINPEKEALFIGNSHNDKYAWESGIRTLLINPNRVGSSYYNSSIWNDTIRKTEDLSSIKRFINF